MEAAKIRRGIFNALSVLIGVLLITISINSFFLKLKIAPGGVSGLATVIHYLTGFSVGSIVLVLNIPLFIAGFIAFGKRFSVKTLIATILLSFFLDNTLWLPQITDDMLLASLFGGIVMGLGMALVFKGNATTGGTDILARVVNKYFPAFNVGEQLFVIDGFVVIFAMCVFRNFDVGLYAIITIWLSAKIIDLVFTGVGFAKAMFIISDNGDEIGSRILSEVGRGVTGVNGEGLYSGTGKKVLLTVVDRRQIPVIKAIAKSIDKKAFIIVTDAREVLGEGFGQ